MKDQRLLSRDRPARALAFIMALILAGCSGGTSPATGTSEGTPAEVASPSAAVSGKPNPKIRNKGLAPGGELGVRERRAQKLKEKAAAKE